MAHLQARLDWGTTPGAAANRPCLSTSDPRRWPVASGWQGLVDGFWASATGIQLQSSLEGRLLAGATIYPPEPLRALALTPLDAVRVVILGQDPYHGAGQAEGLAFSVAPGVKPPPSLRNVFAELQRDLGCPVPPHGSLVHWAEQGVLLLNACLTVEDGRPGSHAGLGWEVLTDAVIRQCSDTGSGKAFLLWGGQAQKKAAQILPDRNLVLCANHPSPLSARRGPAPFLGCGHFGEVNRWLEKRNQAPIIW